MSSAGATATTLRSSSARPAIHRHVRDAGLPIVNGSDRVAEAQVVVVAGHDGFDYAELREATSALRGGATLLGATRDATFPMPGGCWPGSGAILAAVEVAGGTTAETFGKPAPWLFRTAVDRLGPGAHLSSEINSTQLGCRVTFGRALCPPKAQRQLRTLTRYRKSQIAERQQEANRLHKALEDIGHARAIGAIKHPMLTAYCTCSPPGQTYTDLGGDYYDRRDPDRLTRRLVGRLHALGNTVTITPNPA
jgi:hypothetical protein